MKKFALKTADASKEKIASLLTFSDDELNNSSPDEIIGMLVLSEQRSKDVELELESLMEHSGIDVLVSESNALKVFKSKAKRALVNSGYLNNESQILVNLHDDNIVSVNNERYETEDVIKSSFSCDRSFTYRVNPNIALLDFVDKLMDLNIPGSIRLGSIPMTQISRSEFNELRALLIRFNLIAGLSINKASLNADLNDFDDARNSLLELNYIIADCDAKLRKATNKLINNFRDEEEQALDVIPLNFDENLSEEDSNND